MNLNLKKEFLAHPLMAAVCFVIAATGALIGGCLVYLGRPGSAAVFFCIGLAFFFISVPYASVIAVDEHGLVKRFLGRELLRLPWDEIAEVGIAGTKVFNSMNRQKTGTLCIYFSRRQMTDDDHFNMLLRWPDRDIPFLTYNLKRLQAVQMCWKGEITFYNAGDIRRFIMGDGLQNAKGWRMD